MTAIGWFQILLYCAMIVAMVPLLGAYMTRVFGGERTFLSPLLRPVEVAIYKVAGVNEQNEQHAVTYTVSMLLFHVGGFLILYLLMRLQAGLPFNPAKQSAVAEDLSFNTAMSFITNTNWQNYGGESTMSYLLQMLGLTHQNFLSAATGIVLAVALIRGFARHSVRTVGNFWVDITRVTLYVLIPICVPFALFLVWQGMPQTLGPYVDVTTLEGAKQTIAVGPVASQVAIKMLGTNGGGFFNANAAHPFENPTAFSNYVQMISIFALGAALTNVFGRMVGDQRQGWAVLAVMGVLFIAGVIVCYGAEAHGNDALNALGLAGGNMEGKEVRFGIAASALFAVITTAASCGAVNAMHDSLTAIGGMIPLINIELGEIIVGGVGSGMYGMLLFVIISIFVAGLMVGRTPEYVGKKIEAKEVKMAMLAVLILPLMYLGSTAVCCCGPSRGRRHWQSGSARLHRDPLCLHVADRQQRLGLRRAQRQYAVLQSHRRSSDGRRPVLDDHPNHGDRGLARRQEVDTGVGRHLPHHRRFVRRPRCRRDRDHRWPHLFPGARARSDRRAARDKRRHTVLRRLGQEPFRWKPRPCAGACRSRHCSMQRSSRRPSAPPSSSSIRAR
jgi:K+-transporting ATPase ATPase A chain